MRRTATSARGENGTSAASLALVESYRRLADVFHDVLSEQSLDALLERIADTVSELIPHDDLAFYEADEATRELRGRSRPRGLCGRGARGRALRASARGSPVGPSSTASPCSRTGPTSTPGFASSKARRPIRSRSSPCPLIARGCVKGALNIYRVGLKEFTEDEFRLAVRFGDAAALALDNAHVRATLELQAQTDPLTGLWNHRAFHERLRNEVVQASTERGSVALVMLDLDDFKKVNDIYGHAVGDHGAGRARGRAPRHRPPDRRRLPDRRRGVRDHPPGR